MDNLTSDNSVLDNVISVASSAQGQQVITTPANATTSVGLSPGLEQLWDPTTLSKILATINNAASSEFTVKSYNISFSVKNTSNQDLYATRMVWKARKDVPLSVATSLKALIDGSFTASTAIAAPYNVVNQQSNVGATLFMAPGWTTWFKCIKVKGYHLRGGQEIRYTRKSRKNRRFTQAQLRPGGTIRELCLRGNIFDTWTLRGGAYAEAAVANPTFDSAKAIFAVIARVHYTWINDITSSGGTTQARIGTAAAVPLIIPENNPGAPIAEADL